jgi:hypothetical protein
VRLFSWHDTLYVVSASGACFLSMALHSNLYGSDPGTARPHWLVDKYQLLGLLS